MVIPKEAGFLSVVGQSDGLDLWTLERFNQQRTGHQRFSAPVPAREDAALSIPDFVIDRIPSRLISLVDSEGNPVSGGQVSAECIETMVQDGKVYRLNQPLAQPAITDSQGRCNLTLNRSNWEHGTIRVTKFSREDIPTGAGYTVAESTITPSDLSPIKLVLRRPWIVSGQVILDGRPATELIVGLEQKLQDQQGDFYWLKAGMDKVDDQGRFEISCVPGSDFEILLRRDTSGVTSVHRAKIPIQKVSSDHYTTGTISISSDQLRSVP